MRHRGRAPTWTLAAVPYLLLSCSQQAGIVTVVQPDGSGERLVYARAAGGRADEARGHLRKLLPGQALEGRNVGDEECWYRDTQVANLATVGDVEVANLGIVQKPLSIHTKHVWTETLAFDPGDATDAELHGQSLVQLHYAVTMPGKILSQRPPANVTDNVAEWEVKVGPEPQTFTVESQTVRWAYLALWLYVLAFALVKAAAFAPTIAKQVKRKPRRI